LFGGLLASLAWAQEGGQVLTKAPELLEFAEAELPAGVTSRTASVVLRLTLGVDGRVEEVEVVESGGEDFDAAASEAARRFLFSPAEIDGAPSRVRILYRYEFVERLELPTTAIFSGVVRDRERRVPVPGVTVTLADGRRAVTDGEGRFEIRDVEPGTLSITLEGERLTALGTEETFVAGERLDATYDVFLLEEGEEGDDMEILVSAPALRKAAVSTEVGAEEARKIPGTQGDVLRVVESLPGVARAGLGSGSLVVWGAAPDDTGVYVDGVRVPRLYHDGGLRSVLGSDIVRSVELVPGGFGAAYGRGLGGLVTVKTARVEDEESVRATVAADLYDGSAFVSVPVVGRGGIAVGGRYGWVGPLLDQFYPAVQDFFPIPRYYDVQLRAGVKLRPNEALDVTGIVSGDRTVRTAPNADPAREASEDRRVTFQRAWLRYSRDGGDGTVTSVVVFGGADQQDRVASFGPVETSIRTRQAVVGARASYRARIHPALTLEGGLDSEVSVASIVREGSTAVPGREGDVRAFGQPPPDQIATDSFQVVQANVAPYVEAALAPWKERLTVVAGLRLDPQVRSVSRALPQVGIAPTNGLLVEDTRLEPRISVRAAPLEAMYVMAAAGLYSQQPQAQDLSAAFGNPSLPAPRGAHYLAGIGGRPAKPLSIDATGYFTRSRDLAMRSEREQPARGAALEATGDGRAYGAQFMLRLDAVAGFSGWISYSLGWSERRNTPESSWRPSDFDQRHVLTALVAYDLPLGFDVGLRARVASGYPRSEVQGAVYDVRRDVYQPVFGEQNALRLPTFFQADVRVAKEFAVRASTFEISLDVQNVTNFKNTEEFIYSSDYQERGGISSLPILPVLGVRWKR